MEYVKSYKELEVCKLARELSKEIFGLSRGFPNGEMYSLTDQVRRSSLSIRAQIAEAWGKRLYKNHFVSKLTDADSEQLETQHWIETALDCLYISDEIADGLSQRYASVGKMLNSMISKSESFCGKVITKDNESNHHANTRLLNTTH